LKSNRNINALNIGLILLGAIAYSVRASEPAGSTNLLDNENALHAFVDQIVTSRMRETHVPGAVVTIVRGDHVIFNKGYGFADLEQHTPVDPDRTLFRIASVSKVFNAMAVMRLVDEGLIDVNEDIRPRLAAVGFKLDHEAYGPVTLRALLTHSAGIRDLNIPGVTSPEDPGQLLPLGLYLQKCLPLRWQEPGESVLYTDHGITLAGYVVELASKTSFQDAVLQRVMRPLGMNHTCYDVSEEQRANLAVAYTYRDSTQHAIPFRYTNLKPAVGVLTTGGDMARLMICHLSNCDGFLKPETVKLMHEPQYSDDARLGGQWACGFYLGNGSQLNHFGGAYGFTSDLGISLRRGIAVFSAQNQPGTPSVFLLDDLLNTFLDRETRAEMAEPAKPSVTAAAAMADIQSVVGTYVLDRTLSLGIKPSKEDYIHIRYAENIRGIEVEYPPPRADHLRLTEVGPLLFHSAENDKQVSFRMSKDGKKTYLIDYNWTTLGAFRKISSSDHATVPLNP
jgi:CubicO group peptidase (beta-lactamase class C family)